MPRATRTGSELFRSGDPRVKPDIDLFGVFVPTLLVLALGSYIALRLLSAVLARLGVYRHVWHPALFNLCLYFTVLGATVLFMEQVKS
nr:DUF1656 domain-containing protein [Rhodovulum sulfidophilum]